MRVGKDQVGRFVLLPGDPDRVPIIASFLERPKKIASHREFTVWNGYIGSELVTVASTGIGSPAAAIAAEAVRILIRWDKEAKKRKLPSGFRSNFSCPSMVLL